MCQGFQVAVLRTDVRKVVDPANGQLVSDVERRQTALTREVVPILSTARVDDAAKQLVSGVVDVLRERIVRAEVQSLREAMHKVHGTRVINPGTRCRKRRQASKEFVHYIRMEETLGLKFIEGFCRDYRIRNGFRCVGGAKVRGKRGQSSARNVRIKCRGRVQPALNGQAQAPRANVAHLDARVPEEFVLNAEGPSDDLR